MTHRVLIGAVAAFSLASTAQAGTILHVDDDAPPGGDGLSWNTAYRYLRDALDVASGGGISEIRVAQGTYKPDQNDAGDVAGMRGVSFNLVDEGAVLGGFAGIGEPDPDARDVDLYTTTLSGDLLGDDGPNFTNRSDNSYHVVLGPEVAVVGFPSIIDGFTVTGGETEGSGGGLWVVPMGFVAVGNCAFLANRAGWGGAVAVASDASIVDCTFVDNQVFALGSPTRGGAIYHSFSELTITGSSFTGNSTAGDSNGFGGAVYASEGITSIAQCTFTANSATSFGGAVYQSTDGHLSVSECVFEGNSTTSSGGGIAALGSGSTTVSIVDTVFMKNNAKDGGALSNISEAMDVANCVFQANSAVEVGGGVHQLGGDLSMRDCVLTGNSAIQGGAVGNEFGNGIVLANCLITGNTADMGSGVFKTGAHPSFPSVVELINCTLTGNVAAPSGGCVFDDFDDAPTPMLVDNCILRDNEGGEIMDLSGTTTTATYSNIDGGFPGLGNIDADPLFVDPGNGDYRLQPGSPCIDAGDNTAVPPDVETDLDGNPRFLEVPETPDTGNGDLPVVDMGAYEALGGGCLAVTSQETVCHGDGTTFTLNVEGLNACTGGMTQVSATGSGGAPGEEACFTLLVDDGGFCCSTEICVTIPDCSGAGDPPCPADLDGDGTVGLGDMLIVLGAWGTPGGDANGDGVTDILDFLAVLGTWGDC